MREYKKNCESTCDQCARLGKRNKALSCAYFKLRDQYTVSYRKNDRLNKEIFELTRQMRLITLRNYLHKNFMTHSFNRNIDRLKSTSEKKPKTCFATKTKRRSPRPSFAPQLSRQPSLRLLGQPNQTKKYFFLPKKTLTGRKSPAPSSAPQLSRQSSSRLLNPTSQTSRFSTPNGQNNKKKITITFSSLSEAKKIFDNTNLL
jgi:hypothetical protein